MNRMRWLPLVLTVWLMTILVSDVSASPAANTDHKQAVFQAYENLRALKNYHIKVETAISMVIVGTKATTTIDADCDIQAKPLLAKNTMTVAVEAAAGAETMPKDEVKVVEYIEEKDGKFYIYSNDKGHWQTITLPAYDPLVEYGGYYRMLSSAVPVQETESSSVYKVGISASYLKERLEGMASAGGQPVTLPKGIFKDIKDITQTVTIDKKTGCISRVEADLSDILPAIAKSVSQLKEIPEGQKWILNEMLANGKLRIVVTFSQLNMVENIVIPEEVKTKSVPIT